MVGQGAARRANAKRSKAKRDRKNAQQQHDGAVEPTLPVPTITEDDLLAFQLSHFGDDTKPDVWFVDAETALNFDPTFEDDGLGYYEDGVKRTLTDEQIEMFRHSEMEALAREERIRKANDDEHGDELSEVVTGASLEGRRGSLASNNSSVEDDLLDLAQAPSPTPRIPFVERQRSQSSRSRSETSSSQQRGRERRKQEIPYKDRHKRKWEGYIEDTDPVEGSRTHRRIAREMDEQQEASVDLDY